MPRKQPDQVIEHRLSLQDAERKAIVEPIGKILGDVEKFTNQANIARQVAVYGALGLGGVALWYVPKVWSETTKIITGTLETLNPISAPERFVDWWERRGVPTGVVGDFIKGRGLFGSE